MAASAKAAMTLGGLELRSRTDTQAPPYKLVLQNPEVGLEAEIDLQEHFENKLESGKTVVKVGRHPDNDIVLDSARIPLLLSRKHAQFELDTSRRPHVLLLGDQQTGRPTTNGTYIDNKRIDNKSPVLPGCIVSFGGPANVIRDGQAHRNPFRYKLENKRTMAAATVVSRAPSTPSPEGVDTPRNQLRLREEERARLATAQTASFSGTSPHPPALPQREGKAPAGAGPSQAAPEAAAPAAAAHAGPKKRKAREEPAAEENGGGAAGHRKGKRPAIAQPLPTEAEAVHTLDGDSLSNTQPNEGLSEADLDGARASLGASVSGAGPSGASGSQQRGSQQCAEEELKCAICHEIMVTPHGLRCTHTFCGMCIWKWFAQGKRTCPNCREECPDGPVEQPVLEKLIMLTVVPNLQQAERDQRDENQRKFQEYKQKDEFKLALANRKGRATHAARALGRMALGGVAPPNNVPFYVGMLSDNAERVARPTRDERWQLVERALETLGMAQGERAVTAAVNEAEAAVAQAEAAADAAMMPHILHPAPLPQATRPTRPWPAATAARRLDGPGPHPPHTTGGPPASSLAASRGRLSVAEQTLQQVTRMLDSAVSWARAAPAPALTEAGEAPEASQTQTRHARTRTVALVTHPRHPRGRERVVTADATAPAPTATTTAATAANNDPQLSAHTAAAVAAAAATNDARLSATPLGAARRRHGQAPTGPADGP